MKLLSELAPGLLTFRSRSKQCGCISHTFHRMKKVFCRQTCKKSLQVLRFKCNRILSLKCHLIEEPSKNVEENFYYLLPT